MKPMLTILLALAVQFLFAQTKETYISETGQITKERNADFLLQRIKIKDSLWRLNIYRIKGPRIASIETKDEEGNIPNGNYIKYDFSGYIDTVGTTSNGLKVSSWKIYRGGLLINEIIYDINGIETEERDSTQSKSAKFKFLDSIKALSAGKPVETESTFPKGGAGWGIYMSKTMHYPEKSINEQFQGIVIIQFVVTKEGKIANAEVEKSVQYDLDKEALRIIQNSPDWVPATINGVKIDTYKTQPISFKLGN